MIKNQIRHSGKTFAQMSLGLIAVNQYLRWQAQNTQKNECGGILAYVTTKEQKDAIGFQHKYAHLLQKLPYYQCGLAMNDLKTNKVVTMKFTSEGQLQDDGQIPQISPS